MLDLIDLSLMVLMVRFKGYSNLKSQLEIFLMREKFMWILIPTYRAGHQWIPITE